MKILLTILTISSLIYGRSSSRNAGNPQRIWVQHIYTAELGIREKTGRNDGQRVEDYLHAVALRKGDPWCAAFVCWVFDKAGVANPHTGWAPALFPGEKVIWERTAAVQAGGKLRKTVPMAIPQRGDVFGIWFPEKGRIAHAGFVDKWEGSWVITVEGNTNEAGSREGEGVWRKRRLVESICKVADFIDWRHSRQRHSEARGTYKGGESPGILPSIPWRGRGSLLRGRQDRDIRLLGYWVSEALLHRLEIAAVHSFGHWV